MKEDRVEMKEQLENPKSENAAQGFPRIKTGIKAGSDEPITIKGG